MFARAISIQELRIVLNYIVSFAGGCSLREEIMETDSTRCQRDVWAGLFTRCDCALVALLLPLQVLWEGKAHGEQGKCISSSFILCETGLGDLVVTLMLPLWRKTHSHIPWKNPFPRLSPQNLTFSLLSLSLVMTQKGACSLSMHVHGSRNFPNFTIPCVSLSAQVSQQNKIKLKIPISLIQTFLDGNNGRGENVSKMRTGDFSLVII